MKIIYLLPPSEGKNHGWIQVEEKLSFNFSKPFDIAINATQKDLKCQWKRYEEGIELNKNIEKSDKLPAIQRYSGVMYNAINYEWMEKEWKKYFEDNFLVLSGIYGMLRPQDMIGNYKLPIETKWLYAFWWDKITNTLNNLQADYIVDLLPGAYAKIIQWKNLNSKIIRVNFLHTKNGELKKISHGVKKIKWEYIHDICEKGYKKLEDFPGKKVQIWENEYHVNLIFD